jgi:hypothetical protein
MVETVSTKYGTPTRPVGEISFPTNELYRSTEKVIARWEDSRSSINLVPSRFLNSFSLVMISKQLDAQAASAIAKSLKMEGDDLEAARQKNLRFFARSAGPESH